MVQEGRNWRVYCITINGYCRAHCMIANGARGPILDGLLYHCQWYKKADIRRFTVSLSMVQDADIGGFNV